MIEELYQKNLMRLAAAATGAGKLENPDAEITLDNPTCGDRITIQVRLEDGSITELAQENRACLLCQASASLLAENAVGLNLEELQRIKSVVQDILKKDAKEFPKDWEKLEHFNAVREHKSRHLCVLLPFNALETLLKE